MITLPASRDFRGRRLSVCWMSHIMTCWPTITH